MNNLCSNRVDKFMYNMLIVQETSNSICNKCFLWPLYEEVITIKYILAEQLADFRSINVF